DPHKALKDKGIVDSGCFRHITGNKAHLADYQEFKDGSIAFGGSNERITGKGKIKTGSPSEGIFTDSSYDDEGVVTDFNNLETTHWKMKVRLMLCKRNCCSSKFRRQEEGIDYNEDFAPVARIEAIRIFLAFASYMRFIVYQMDVKSAFLYGIIDEEVYVSQPPGFVDPKFPNKVYKVVKALYGLHQAPRAWSSRKKMTPLVKDEEAVEVDVHLYRSMIGSLMYMTASRPDIMFTVCACSRFQVTPKTSHLQVVKRIFRKSTTEGCQFLGRRLISWQCKKQTIVATSNIEAKYVAVLKIHTDDNVADLLTKAFDVSSKELASPKQTALGKDISNPLMAGRLPKTTLPTSQDKYVKDMLKKFDMESVRTATTPYEVLKHKSKDELDDAVNVHLYRSMIGSFMYLTASRPDIMFAVSVCSRHQVTPMTSHLNVVKKIFKYLKGQPNLGLWYPRDSPFQLKAYSDSDYVGSYGDRKSTTGGCHFWVEG
nr:hypothetical protein [Tanacetum cinerariifolium]